MFLFFTLLYSAQALIISLENLVENYIIIDDKRIAFNLNSKQDYDLLGTT